MTDLPKPPATSRRTAWALVIIMTVLLVAALLGVVWGFFRQAGIFMAGKAAPATVTAPVSIPLPPGGRIVSTHTEAGRLVVQVEAPGGGEVEIIDLASGRLITRIRSH